jgi:hypothetical protein
MPPPFDHWLQVASTASATMTTTAAMKIATSIRDMRHIAHRLCVPTRTKLNPKCAVANIHEGRRPAVPAVPHALTRTLTTDHRCGSTALASDISPYGFGSAAA